MRKHVDQLSCDWMNDQTFNTFGGKRGSLCGHKSRATDMSEKEWMILDRRELESLHDTHLLHCMYLETCCHRSSSFTKRVTWLDTLALPL